MSHTLTPPLVSNTPVIYAPSVRKASRLQAGGGRGRAIAYRPRLDVGLRASDAYRQPSRKKPAILTERFANDSLVTKMAKDNLNSTSYGQQTSYDGFPSYEAYIEFLAIIIATGGS